MKNAILLITIVSFVVITNSELLAQDAENVELIGQLSDEIESANEVVVVGNLAYVTGGEADLYVIDISEPENPVVIGNSNESPGSAKSLDVAGSYAYLTYFDYGLRVFQIDDPENPREIGACQTEGRPYGISVSGDYAYMACLEGDLCVVSIEDPEHPNQINHLNIHERSLDTYISENFLYVSQERGGMRIFSIENPVQPREIGHFDINGSTYGVKTSGDFAYLAEWDVGLRIISISDPQNPLLVGQYEAPDRRITGVAVSDDYAYLVGSRFGLKVISIVNPENPVEVGYYDTEGSAQKITVLENRLICVADGENFGIYRNLLLRAGVIQGYVLDVENEAPLEGALVTATNGSNAVTDEEGFFRIDRALMGDIDITASLDGFNDETLENLFIDEDDTLELVFLLTHPEFELSTNEIETELESGELDDFSISIFNSGNGPLEWSVEERLRGDYDADPWESRSSFYVSEMVDDPRIQGIAFVDDLLYVAGGGGDENLIYLINLEGEFVGSYPQPTDTHYGLNDLTYDGELLWGIDSGGEVYGFTLEGEPIFQWDCPVEAGRAITWDQRREILWCTSATSERISGCSVMGEELVSVNQFGLNIYGLTYRDNDPDGYQLYAIHSDDLESMELYKIDIAHHDSIRVKDLKHPESGSPRGLFIADPFDIYSTVLLVATNKFDEDRIDVFQMFSFTDWMIAEPDQGIVNQQEERELVLTLDTGDLLPENTYEGRLLFTHNAVGGSENILITLNVEPLSTPDEEHSLPNEFMLNTPYPNPFNSSTLITYSLPVTSQVSLKLFDLVGREISTMFEGFKQAGLHTIKLNANYLPSGLYLVRLNVSDHVFTRKVMLVR